MKRTLAQISHEIGAELIGNPEHFVDSCATLDLAQSNQLSFIYDKKYMQSLSKTKAAVVIISKDFVENCYVDALVVADPYLAYAKAASYIYDKGRTQGGIHPSAVIGDNCSIPKSTIIGANVTIADDVNFGENCFIGPNCIIEAQVKLGANSTLKGNVLIARESAIGERALIHPGAVIGSEGFGFAPDNGTWVRIPQVGKVVIGNDADIGANTTIDRGALSDTVIGNGVKIDNLVQVAHNVQIGDNTAIAGCTGIAGSTIIGKNCTLAGGVGLVGHITIVDGVHVTGMTMVTHSIKEAGVYSSGTPFQKNSDWLKNAVRFKQLDKFVKSFKKAKK